MIDADRMNLGVFVRLLAAVVVLAAAVPAFGKTAAEWDFSKGTQGWTPNARVEGLTCSQEGLIVKNLDALYQPGRRVAGGWLKVKPTLETLDLAIIGATWGMGKRAGWLGSYIIGCRDTKTGKFLYFRHKIEFSLQFRIAFLEVFSF